jgi:hypothetical protein
MKALRAWVLVGGVVGLLGGCALQPALRCTGQEQLAVQESLYFGTAKPVGVVSAHEWAAFLAEVVTPRFPAGFTVWSASGQWQGQDGKIVQEPSFLLQLVYPPDAESARKVQAIVDQYRQRFQQEAVLRVRGQVCMSL